MVDVERNIRYRSSLTDEELLRQAEELREKIEQGKNPPLTGVPGEVIGLVFDSAGCSPDSKINDGGRPI